MKRTNYQHLITAIIASTALYFLGGYLGLSFTTYPNIASPFWPAAGLAVACLFIWGPVASIGIIIGSVAIKVILQTQTNVFILISGVAPAIQALLIYYSLKRTTKDDFFLSSESGIIRFFLLTPIISIVSAGISISALYYHDEVFNNAISELFITWWAGDTLGTLIFAPLFFALFSHHKEWQQRRMLFSTVTLTLILVSIYLLHVVQLREHGKITAQLSQINQSLNSEITQRLQTYQKNLQAINIFFLSPQHVKENDIKDFIEKIKLHDNNATYAYGWFNFNNLINTPSAEAGQQLYSLKPYPYELKIKPLSVIQKLYSECAIGSYIEHDKLSGSTLYRSIETSVTSIENLCASEHLGGVSYIDIDLNSLLKDVTQTLQPHLVNIQLLNHDQTIVFFEKSANAYNQPPHNSFNPKSESLITFKNTFWTLRLEATEAFTQQFSSWTLWWSYFSGFLFTAFACFVILISSIKKAQTQNQIKQKTIELKSTNDLLSTQVNQQKETQILINMQSRILELIAKGQPHQRILDQLCLYTENLFSEGTTATIMVCQNDELSLFSAPSLSQEAQDQIKNIKLSGNTPCAKAFNSSLLQVVDDINNIEESFFISPSIESQISAYWCIPISGHSTQKFGVFSLTHRQPRYPSAHESQLMAVASSLASISFQRYERDKQLKKLSSAVESSPNGIAITSNKGIIEYVNPYFCSYTGYSSKQLIGNDLSRFVQDASDTNIQEFDWDYSISLGESQRDYMGKRPDGTTYWCKQSIATMQDENKENRHVLSIHQDITYEFTSHLIKTEQASHDSLTGLFNHAEFNFQLDKLLTQSTSANHHVLSILNLSQFREINDQYGHNAGDQLLQSVSQLIEKQLRKTDFLARIGGDEFAIIFQQCPMSKAKKILTSIIELLSDLNFYWKQERLSISANAGLVAIDTEQTSREEVIRSAETACYLAKKDLAKNLHIYQPDSFNNPKPLIKKDWNEQFKQALEQQKFELYAQPVFNQKTQTIAQYEILLRLNEGESLLTPTDFLNDAKRLNVMPQIDRWVITQTIKWLKQHPNNTTLLSINLSTQTVDHTFTPWLLNIIEESQINAQLLCFEFNANMSDNELKNAQQLISAVRPKGCHFTMDDFGKNLPSSAYLSTLAIDYLKIDAQYIHDIEHQLVDKALVKAINEIGHIINKGIIAKQVKNQRINHILSAIGIELMQGNYLAEATPLNKIKG